MNPTPSPAPRGNYERLGTVDLDTVFEHVKGNRVTALILGEVVRVKSLRLKTFAAYEPCCSSPDCGLQASYFAVERSLGKRGAPAREGESFHLNLYGINPQGQEVRFTHDHTVARALGGADDDTNTSTMCEPCNKRKGKLEHALVKQQRQALGLNPHTGSREATPSLADPEVRKRRSSEARERLEAMATARGMGVVDYVAHCEAEGQAWAQQTPSKANRQARKPPSFAPQAQDLGMSLMAYSFFRHDHNQHQQALRRPEPARKPSFGRC